MIRQVIAQTGEARIYMYIPTSTIHKTEIAVINLNYAQTQISLIWENSARTAPKEVEKV